MDDLFDGTKDERPPDPRGEWVSAAWQFGQPEGTWLEVKFNCVECGELAYSEDFRVPGLNLMAEKSRDLAVAEEFSAHCESCGTDYELYVESEPGGAHVGSYAGDLTQERMEYRVVSPALDDFDEYIDAVTSNTEFSVTFRDGIRDVRELATPLLTDESGSNAVLARLLFSHVITLVEVYLSDAFVNTVRSDDALVRRAVETIPHFAKRKVPLADVFAGTESVKAEVDRYLVGFVWHRLGDVKQMYRDVLDVSLPDYSDLYKAVLVRHDLIHRNGKTKEGDDVSVTWDGVLGLASLAESFVSDIDHRLNGEDSKDS